jgi:hypothetical protein
VAFFKVGAQRGPVSGWREAGVDWSSLESIPDVVPLRRSTNELAPVGTYSTLFSEGQGSPKILHSLHHIDIRVYHIITKSIEHNHST